MKFQEIEGSASFIEVKASLLRNYDLLLMRTRSR